MKAFRTLLCLALTLTIAGGAIADDTKAAQKDGKKPAAKGDKAAKGNKSAAAKKRAEARKNGNGRKAPALSQFMLRGIELTAEQKKAVAPIDTEFAPKFAVFRKAQGSIYTEEQRKTQQSAQAKIRALGKDATPEKRRALQKEIQASIKLSDEQKAKQAEQRKAFGELRAAYLAKVTPILTDDQKAKLKGGRRAGGKRPAKGDAAGKKPGKKPAKDDAAKKPPKDAA